MQQKECPKCGTLKGDPSSPCPKCEHQEQQRCPGCGLAREEFDSPCPSCGGEKAAVSPGLQRLGLIVAGLLFLYLWGISSLYETPADKLEKLLEAPEKNMSLVSELKEPTRYSDNPFNLEGFWNRLADKDVEYRKSWEKVLTANGIALFNQFQSPLRYCSFIRAGNAANEKIIPSEPYEDVLKKCETLKKNKSQLEKIKEHNANIEDWKERRKSLKSKLNDKTKKAQKYAEFVNSATIKLCGAIVGQLDAQLYEADVRICGTRRRPKKAVLRTIAAKHLTRGQFRLEVTREGKKRVQLKNGRWVQWPLYWQSTILRRTQQAGRNGIKKTRDKINRLEEKIRRSSKKSTEDNSRKIDKARSDIAQLLEQGQKEEGGNTPRKNQNDTTESQTRDQKELKKTLSSDPGVKSLKILKRLCRGNLSSAATATYLATCDKCPPEATVSDSTYKFRDIKFGNFSSSSPEAIVVASGCEPESKGLGGLSLVRWDRSKWKRIFYESGRFQNCVTVSGAERDSMVCSSYDEKQGTGWGEVFGLTFEQDAKKRDLARHTLVNLTADTGDYSYLKQSFANVRPLKVYEDNGAVKIRLKVELGRWEEHTQEDKAEDKRIDKFYEINKEVTVSFVFRNGEFVPTRSSENSLEVINRALPPDKKTDRTETRATDETDSRLPANSDPETAVLKVLKTICPGKLTSKPEDQTVQDEPYGVCDTWPRQAQEGESTSNEINPNSRDSCDFETVFVGNFSGGERKEAVVLSDGCETELMGRNPPNQKGLFYLRKSGSDWHVVHYEVGVFDSCEVVHGRTTTDKLVCDVGWALARLKFEDVEKGEERDEIPLQALVALYEQGAEKGAEIIMVKLIDIEETTLGTLRASIGLQKENLREDQHPRVDKQVDIRFQVNSNPEGSLKLHPSSRKACQVIRQVLPDSEDWWMRKKGEFACRIREK